MVGAWDQNMWDDITFGNLATAAPSILTAWDQNFWDDITFGNLATAAADILSAWDQDSSDDVTLSMVGAWDQNMWDDITFGNLATAAPSILTAWDQNMWDDVTFDNIATIAASLGTNYWQLNEGALAPFSTTLDLLVGGNSTASALIAMNATEGSLSFGTNNLVLNDNLVGISTDLDLLTLTDNNLSLAGALQISNYVPGDTTARIYNNSGSLYWAGDKICVEGGPCASEGTVGYDGTPLAGQVAFFSSESNIAGSNQYFWNNTHNLLGIGTNDPEAKLHVTGTYSDNALVMIDQTGGDDILTASASGVTRLTLGNNGDLFIGGDLTAGGVNVNSDLITDFTGDGLTLSTNTLTLSLNNSGSVLSGLSVDSNGLSLIRTCDDGQVLKWTAAGGWACDDDTSGGVENYWSKLAGVLSPASSEPLAATSAATTVASFTSTGSNLAFQAGGSNYITIDNTGNLTITGEQELRFNDSIGYYTGFQAPSDLTGTQNYVYTLPVGYGTANQVLATDINGVLSWIDVSAGSGGYTNWLLDGDDGDAQTISSGNTAYILGGTNITTAVSDTDTLTINLDLDYSAWDQNMWDDITFGNLATAAPSILTAWDQNFWDDITFGNLATAAADILSAWDQDSSDDVTLSMVGAWDQNMWDDITFGNLATAAPSILTAWDQNFWDDITFGNLATAAADILAGWDQDSSDDVTLSMVGAWDQNMWDDITFGNLATAAPSILTAWDQNFWDDITFGNLATAAADILAGWDQDSSDDVTLSMVGAWDQNMWDDITFGNLATAAPSILTAWDQNFWG
jgi:hypothetical protein